MAIRLPRAGYFRPGLLLGLAACTCPVAGCTDDGGGPDWCADGPVIVQVRAAAQLLPGSAIELSGTGFDVSCGELRAFLRGTLDGRPVEAEATPDVDSIAALRLPVGPELFFGLGADQGRFTERHLEIGVVLKVGFQRLLHDERTAALRFRGDPIDLIGEFLGNANRNRCIHKAPLCTVVLHCKQ